MVSCGESHTLAVTMDGLLYKWGRYEYERLGNAPGEHSMVPEFVQVK